MGRRTAVLAAVLSGCGAKGAVAPPADGAPIQPAADAAAPDTSSAADAAARETLSADAAADLTRDPWLEWPDGGAPGVLANNTWYRVMPRWSYPGQAMGAFQQRSWGTLRYDRGRNTIVFYEGFGPSSHGNYCIYGNALYEFAPVTGAGRLLKLSNWRCDAAPPTPLPENAGEPTPRDRHTYAQFAHVPETDAIYLVAGASGSGLHPYDAWKFDRKTGAWRQLPDPPDSGGGHDCVCEGSLIYRPPAGARPGLLYFFRGPGRVYTFDVTAERWSKLAPKGPAPRPGNHGAYDPRRERFVFYGNGWTQNDTGSQDFVWFDAATDTFSVRPVTGTWPPPKSFAPIEYNSKHGVYMLHGGDKQSDTWIYDPASERWTELAASATPAGVSTTLAYDEADDLLVRLIGDTFWVLRYAP